jgi:hypothetical protein
MEMNKILKTWAPGNDCIEIWYQRVIYYEEYIIYTPRVQSL